MTGWPELTGNGNAELWGWFPSDATGNGTPRVEKIDKTSGAPLTTYMLPSLQGMPSAWAFAFWGGDYWIFLAKDIDAVDDRLSDRRHERPDQEHDARRAAA